MAQTETTGLFQGLNFGTSTANTNTGLLHGGDLTRDTQLRKRRGIGGTEIRKGGLVKIGGKADFLVTKTNAALITYAGRAAYPYGALTSLKLEGGAAGWSRKYTGALIETFGLDWAVGEALKASVSWGALDTEAGTGVAPNQEGNTVWEDYEFVAEFDETEYGILALSIKGTNNVSFKTSGDTKASNKMRFPLFALMGYEEITVDLTAGTPLNEGALGLLDDELPTNLAISLLSSSGPQIELANLAPNTDAFAFVDGNTQAEWKYQFHGSSVLGCMTFTAPT